MATYVVEIKLPYERRSSTFGVFHSTSDTMFSPTFSEGDELIAHIFAAEYSTGHLLRDYTEAAQQRLVSDVGLWLCEAFPEWREHMTELPEAWRALLPNEDGDEFPFRYDVSDLLEWYQNGDDRADVVQGLFRAWRRARS